MRTQKSLEWLKKFMRIDKSDRKAIFEFTADEYFLVHNLRDAECEWSLNSRIDRSEKGKDDDCGMPVIFLTDEEAEEIKRAGFTWIEI